MKDRSPKILRHCLATPCILALLKKLRDDGGGSLVEVALIFALFVPTMVLGTVYVASMEYASIEVSDAAHAGAAYAAQVYIANSNTALPTQSQVTAAARNDAPELPNMLASGTSLSATMSTGCGTGTATAGNTVPTCSSGTLPYVQVTTQATVIPMVQLLGFAASSTMSARARINLVN
ncbi:MAG: hypothetical protein WAM85_09680 [Terracidiphilus sp.]